MREKILPELDDDFASDASEFDTLEELRADIREKVGKALSSRAEEDFRIAAIDAAVDNATVEVPDELVDRPRDRTLGADGTPARPARHGPERLPADAGQNPRGADRGVEARRGERAEARGRGHGDRRGGGDRGLRGGDDRGARAQRRTRTDDAREAAGAAAPERPRRDGPRRHQGPQGDRAGRRVGQTDPARAGRGARGDLDAGEGARGKPASSGPRGTSS